MSIVAHFVESNPSAQRTTVLVVEDEVDLRDAMVSYLNLEGFHADGVGSVAALKAWFNTHDCQIVLLDLGLPDGDGLDVLQALRRVCVRKSSMRGGLGIIVVTARGQVENRITGLTLGADAYLVKPVDFRELVAVTRSVADRIASTKTIAWQFNSVSWTLQAPNGTPPLRLTRSESAVVSALMSLPGQVVSRDKLIVALGGNPLIYDPRRMEILIRRLRKKAESAFGLLLPVETVHSVGYAFTALAKVQTLSD